MGMCKLGETKVSVVRINGCPYLKQIKLRENVRAFHRDRENCP